MPLRLFESIPVSFERGFTMTDRAIESGSGVSVAPEIKIHAERRNGVRTFWVPGMGIAVVDAIADAEKAVVGMRLLMDEHHLSSGELLFPSTGRIPASVMSVRDHLASSGISVTRGSGANLEIDAQKILKEFWVGSHAASQHLLGY